MYSEINGETGILKIVSLERVQFFLCLLIFYKGISRFFHYQLINSLSVSWNEITFTFNSVSYKTDFTPC